MTSSLLGIAANAGLLMASSAPGDDGWQLAAPRPIDSSTSAASAWTHAMTPSDAAPWCAPGVRTDVASIDWSVTSLD